MSGGGGGGGGIGYSDESHVALVTCGGDDEESAVPREAYLYSFGRRGGRGSGLCCGLFGLLRGKCTVDVAYASILAVLCLVILFVLIFDR